MTSTLQTRTPRPQHRQELALARSHQYTTTLSLVLVFVRFLLPECNNVSLVIICMVIDD
jgi:hypothetical protein